MLECGHSIADCQIVTPLNENPLFVIYQVAGPVGDAARMLVFPAELTAGKKARKVFIDQANLLLGQSFSWQIGLLVAEATVSHSYCVYPFPVGIFKKSSNFNLGKRSYKSTVESN